MEIKERENNICAKPAALLWNVSKVTLAKVNSHLSVAKIQVPPDSTSVYISPQESSEGALCVQLLELSTQEACHHGN